MGYNPETHDIRLNGQDFRVLSRQRDSAPEFVAKYNTGEQGENDLDLFKSKSTDTFAGGQWQQRWLEDSLVANIINGYFNEVDEVLYPTPDNPSQGIAAPSGLGNITNLAVMNNNLFAVANDGTFNGAQFTETDKSQNTILTKPANFTNAGTIKSIAVWNNHLGASELWMAGDENGNTDVWAWVGSGTTITTKSTEQMTLIGASRGTGYGVKNGSALLFHDGTDFVITGKRFGGNLIDPQAVFEFNGRLWCAKEDGLYQWDGVETVKIIDFSQNESADVAVKRAILNGWLYYFNEGFLYRFNGGTVEKLRDFRGLTVAGICAGKDRIWIVTSGGSTWVDDPKLPYTSTDTYIHCFDQVGWFTWKEYTSAVGPASGIIYWDGHIVVAHNNTTSTSSGEFQIWDLADEFTDADSDPMIVELSEFDANFPNIDKYLSKIEVDYENLDASDTIKVEVRFYDGDTWGSYNDLGNITTATENFIELADLGIDGNFRSMQIKVTLTRTSGSSSGIRDISFRYTINPEVRWRWVLRLANFNEDLEELGADRVNPNQYRFAIDEALESNSPVDMLDVHWTRINGALNNSQTSVVVHDAYIFKVNDLLLVGTEKMLVTAIDTGTNTLTVVRGSRNTTAATHDDNERAYISQEVYVTRLLNEDLVPRDEQDMGDNDGTEYESTYLLEIVEA